MIPRRSPDFGYCRFIGFIVSKMTCMTATVRAVLSSGSACLRTAVVSHPTETACADPRNSPATPVWLRRDRCGSRVHEWNNLTGRSVAPELVDGYPASASGMEIGVKRCLARPSLQHTQAGQQYVESIEQKMDQDNRPIAATLVVRPANHSRQRQQGDAVRKAMSKREQNR